MSQPLNQQPKFKTIALALSLGTFGILLFSSAPLLAQPSPPTVSPLPSASSTDSEIYNQLQEQLAAARKSTQQGQVEAATAALNQAIALAKSIQSTEIRDQALYATGLAWLELPSGLEQVPAITQAMTYETLGVTDQLRVQLEKALIIALVQSDQVQQAIALIDPLPSGIRDQQGAYLIETLTNAGKLSAALPLAERFIPAESYWRFQANNTIIRAYIAAEQYEAARAFLQAQPFADPLDQVTALGDIALWAGRAGQLETASTVIEDISESRRAAPLVELARAYHYRDQTETATNLLAAATQLPSDPNDSQSGWSTAKLIALAYADLGQPSQAQQILAAAASNPPADDSYFPITLIETYLSIGALDPATSVLASLDNDSSRYDALIRMAEAYTKQGQQAEAVTLLNQIPDRALMPLLEYADPKIELLTQILDNSLETGEFDLAIQIVESLNDPANQVQTWVKIATAYPDNQRTVAIESLEEALRIARTVEREYVVIDRHFSYSKSNADLLKVVAEGYRTLGQTDQAIATIREALTALEAFRSDSPLAIGGVLEGGIDYGAIAQLARDWQQQDFYEKAIGELEKQLAETESIATETALPVTLSTTEQILALVRLTYQPNQPVSDRHQHYLARLTDVRAQTTEPTEQLDLLLRLIPIYHEIDQLSAMEETVQQIIELTAQLPVEVKDGTLSNLAVSIATLLDSETETPSPLIKTIFSQISSPQSQVDGLRLLIVEAAYRNKTALALSYFEDFLSLSEQSLSPSDRDDALVNLNNSFIFRIGDAPTSPPATPAQLTILMRIPAYISDPNLRAFVAIGTAPHLPIAESTSFYATLTETLAQLPNTYNKREMLWQSLNYTINLESFDQAEQLANTLEDGYRQYALGWIETARQQQ
ncbi:tetratricopeptide repeat protein [Leptothoe sp. PORK10 BA2]|uniref:tetratricopeptide repeat protein n=1 Tax=Leptothoe sp. PORK10 BA2 TaxID=3110254 RepID=UPI002B1EC09B|nr:hypothetical protein [Leptothoe sp. PORK10 BA2]MEA5467190.1 hypothetical protein [Leptothoe sp. PORK10 BA2]